MIKYMEILMEKEKSNIKEIVNEIIVNKKLQKEMTISELLKLLSILDKEVHNTYYYRKTLLTELKESFQKKELLQIIEYLKIYKNDQLNFNPNNYSKEEILNNIELFFECL